MDAWRSQLEVGHAAAAGNVAATERGGIAVLRGAITATFAGEIAVVSSFGAESALLLALVADIDPSVPVLFLDTLKHFPETLAYRRALARHLGLTDVRTITPDATEVARRDPAGDLHAIVPDDCCDVRKTAPYGRATAPFRALVNGRKRYQTAERSALRYSETVDGQTIVTPLADWSAGEIAAEIRRRDLPAHPLVARGYPSIGCAPCTHPVAPGAPARSGRWLGFGKTECGIHRAQDRAREDRSQPQG